jgi:ribosomal protein S18 acetylase RimI-like enzyme
MSELTIAIEKSPDDKDFAWIQKNLIDHNEHLVGPENHERILLSARNGDDTLVGGLIASIFWDTLHIDIIWTDPEYRKLGVASALLFEAESEAVRRNCILAILDSFDFQAPEFYVKRGYEQVGRIDDYPKGHTKYIFRKKLK